jgi:hypothetical protein
VHVDQGRILIGQLTKLTLALAVIAVLFLDGLAVGAARVSVETESDTAARAAALEWGKSRNVQKSYDAAAAAVADQGISIKTEDYEVDPEAGTLTLTAQRDSTTYVAHRMSFFDDLTQPEATGRAELEPNR